MRLPYLFGGLPSIADHVLMGPFFAHLARDPEPARRMKRRAPRVFRWTEHMNTPELQSPEFADFPTTYLAEDEVPDTVVSLLQLCLSDCETHLLRSAELYDDWAAAHAEAPPGTLVSPRGVDEPSVGRFEGRLRGVALAMEAAVYPLWVLQRALDWFHTLGEADQRAGRELLAACGGEALLDITLRRRLTRAGSRMALE